MGNVKWELDWIGLDWLVWHRIELDRIGKGWQKGLCPTTIYKICMAHRFILYAAIIMQMPKHF